MTPELHRILVQEHHDDLTRAAEQARAIRRARAGAPAPYRARLIVRFVPSFMRSRPDERSRVRPGAWAKGEG
jgi:hypothetical protein